MKVQHVCFDKDGTLIDVHAYWTHIIAKRAELIVREYGLPQEAVAKLAMAMGADILTEKIVPGGPVGYKPRSYVVQAAIDCLKGWNIELVSDTIITKFAQVDQQLQAENDYNIRVIERVEEALRSLQEKEIRISIFSSDYKENVRRNLIQAGLDQFIDEIVGGDDVSKSKPDPQGFEVACDRIGVPLAESVYVGDTEDDMMMAQRSGSMGGLGVTTGLCEASTLEQHTDYVFSNLKDLVLSIE